MSGGFYGADIAELRELARQAHVAGQKLDGAAAALSETIGSAAWMGPDGSDFLATWKATHAPSLRTAASRLHEMSRVIIGNADAQELTSTDPGSGVLGGGTGPGGGPGLPESSDRPGEPGIDEDTMGEHVDIANPIDLSDEALDPRLIDQGALGDCWFLAAAGAVAQADPQWIRDHMQENDDGTWTVTMYDMWGNPVEITVEGTLAENGVKNADGSDSWISIYEKAAAEYFGGSYSDIDGDIASRGLMAITGNLSTLNYDASLDTLAQQLENGPVVATTEQGDADWFSPERVDDDTVVPNHAYIVAAVETRVNPETGEEEQMVNLINPWGPNGGYLADDDVRKSGELWLTEEEYRENFQFSYATTVDGS